MQQSKLCGDSFVRVVAASPEPMCILATDQQLFDMERFCTNPNVFSILSVDPTFSLGDFNVTCIVYRHLLIKDRRTKESPIMLGPVLVHQRKCFDTYHFFISSLIGLARNLDSVLAFGTDGEEALVLAFKKQLKFAIHLRCFRHMKQNILQKLTVDMGLSQSEASDIILHIFGGKSGPTFFEGLVDAENESTFDENLMKFQSIWPAETDGRLSFYSWFVKYHVDEIKSTMLKPVRRAAGLGDPPMEFCTNDSESINSTIKQFFNFKKSDWPTFNQRIKDFITEQQDEVEKCIIGIGQYEICNEYQQFCVPSSKWFTSLTKDQKQNLVKNFNRASVDDKKEDGSILSVSFNVEITPTSTATELRPC